MNIKDKDIKYHKVSCVVPNEGCYIVQCQTIQKYDVNMLMVVGSFQDLSGRYHQI